MAVSALTSPLAVVACPNRDYNSCCCCPIHSSFHSILEICCDFSYVSTIEAVIDHFHQADICVGIHGAGLANCVLVRAKLVWYSVIIS